MKNRKIVIIGGVAGGATAAARARRVDEHAEITLVEMSGYVSYANCGLPYYIGGDIKERSKLLLQTPRGFHDRYRVRVLTHTEALKIDREKKEVLVRGPDGEQTLSYDSLILSQGGSPVVPPLPGIPSQHAFTLRNVEDTDAIHDFVEQAKPRTAVIAGGGFIGLEMAEALHSRGLSVQVVEKFNQLMPPLDPEFAEFVRQELERNSIHVHLNTGLASVDQHEVRLEDGQVLPADLVILSMGVRPQTSMAKEAGLEIGPTGGVLVNGAMQSSDPSIFVVGDMAEIVHRITGKKVRVPLAGPANRQGRIAGSNAAGARMTYAGAMGTSVVKICERTAAATGLTEKAAKEAGIQTSSVFVHANHHAGYYPGAKQLTLKVVFETKTGRVLGAQAFGSEGVDKRIDVIATAIAGKLTVEDLESLDLSYAPPFSSANDPVNTAGFIGANSRSGFSPVVSPDVFQTIDKSEIAILDVRDDAETARGFVAGAIKIPLPQLRDRLNEIPRDRPVYAYCFSGMRSYLAARILMQNGFEKVYNVAGGYRSIMRMAV